MAGELSIAIVRDAALTHDPEPWVKWGISEIQDIVPAVTLVDTRRQVELPGGPRDFLHANDATNIAREAYMTLLLTDRPLQSRPSEAISHTWGFSTAIERWGGGLAVIRTATNSDCIPVITQHEISHMFRVRSNLLGKLGHCARQSCLMYYKLEERYFLESIEPIRHCKACRKQLIRNAEVFAMMQK